jgi:hypothetical protein
MHIFSNVIRDRRAACRDFAFNSSPTPFPPSHELGRGGLSMLIEASDGGSEAALRFRALY